MCHQDENEVFERLEQRAETIRKAINRQLALKSGKGAYAPYAKLEYMLGIYDPDPTLYVVLSLNVLVVSEEDGERTAEYRTAAQVEFEIRDDSDDGGVPLALMRSLSEMEKQAAEQEEALQVSLLG